jgi:hypothetical protein
VAIQLTFGKAALPSKIGSRLQQAVADSAVIISKTRRLAAAMVVQTPVKMELRALTAAGAAAKLARGRRKQPAVLVGLMLTATRVVEMGNLALVVTVAKTT